MKLFGGLAPRLVLSLALAFACATPLALAQTPAPSQSAAETAPSEKTGWANDRSDLPKDPDYTLGVLPNGMRYLILPHQTPPRQVAMRMVMDVGSMHEAKGQEGIAHFLEHLAFRGTKQLPDGELQRRLEALGLQMAADANASTSSDQTIFMLNLARNDTQSIDTGLFVLRQIASEMSLAPDMVDAERGVVLAEERSRAGPGLTAAVEAIRLQVGDHPYGRPAIGLRSVIDTVTAEQIRAFYDTYYRPERATLVVVGDVKPADLAASIEARFADWTGRGKAGGDPAPVMARPKTSDVALQITEGSADTAITLRWFEPYRDPPPTLAERRRAWVELLGAMVISERMQGLTEAAGRPARFIGAPRPDSIPGVWRGQEATAVGVLDPAKTIDVMVKAHRQALEYGVTQAELDRIKDLRLDAMRQAAAQGRTGSSPAIAEATANSLVSDPVFVSAEDTLAILEQQLPTITVEEVNAMLRSRFSGSPTLVYRGPRAPEGGEAGLRAALAAAMAAPVAPYAAEAVKAWPYSDFGPAGKVAERREVKDLGVTMVTFENGVRLTVKPFTARKDQIHVQVRLGLGRLGMPRDRIDASDMGYILWSTGGLGKLTPTEETRTLAGKRVMASVNQAEDAYLLQNGGIATPADFALQMELMAAMVSDPAYRDDQWAALMASSDRSEAAMPFSAPTVMQFHLDRLLHSNDLRWTVNTKAQRDTWKPEESVAFIRPIVETSPIEVIIVGDIDVEMAIRETARTLGALPPRPEGPERAGLRDVKFPAGGVDVLTHKGRDDQGYALIAWPTGQGMLADVRESRIGWVLGQMLRDEATRELRSNSGATYSPSAAIEFPRELEDYGYIGVMIEIPPERIDGVLALIEKIAAQVAAAPVFNSEVERLVGPRMEQARRDAASSPGYWVANLAGAQTDLRKLDALRTAVSDYEGITPADVQAAAKRWLKPETAWKLKVVPE